MLLTSMGCVLAQGGANLACEAFLLFFVGIGLLLQPPSLGIGSKGNGMLLILALLPLLGLLPASLLPVGLWRDQAEMVYGIRLPYAMATNWWVLLESAVRMWGWIGLAYLCLNMPLEHALRTRLLCFGCLGMALLALVSIAANSNGMINPWIPNARVFSYFPSRNQTGTCFMVWGIISVGMAMYKLRARRWKWGFMLSVCGFIFLIATIQTHSRAAGVLILIGYGVLLWLVRPSWKVSDALKWGVPLALIGMSIFVLAGGDWQRLEKLLASGDFRFSLYGDVLALIRDHWVSGVGLGNFASIIPFYREVGDVAQQTLHPESDVLWMFADLGIGAGVIILLLWLRSLRSTCPWREVEHFSIRTVVAVALMAFSLHSLIDVPMHFLGTAFLAIFLYPFAVKIEFEPFKRSSPYLWRGLGIFLMVVSAVWFVGWAGHLPTHSTIAKVQQDAAIESLLKEKTVPLSWEKVFEASLRHRPLDWWLYGQRGLAYLGFENHFSKGKADFDRALFLEPVSAQVAFWIGLNWLSWDFDQAYQVWSKALKRASFDPDWLCQDILRSSMGVKLFFPYLQKLAQQSLLMRVHFWGHLNEATFLVEFQAYLKENPVLKGLDPAAQEPFWIRFAKGNPQAFLDQLEAHLELQSLWRPKVAALIAQKQWKEASTLAIDHANLPPPLPAANGLGLNELREIFLRDPSDLWRSGQYLKLQIDAGDFAGAALTIDKILAASKADVPAMRYWQAVTAFNLGDFEKSAQSWQRYLFP